MPTTTVQGTILDQGGNPVEGMTVHLMTEFGVITDTTETNSAGFYSVSEFRGSGGGPRVRSNPTALSPHYTDPGAGVLHVFGGINITYTDNFTAQRVNANPTRGTVGTQNLTEDSGTQSVDRTMGDPDGDPVTPVKDSGPSWGSLAAVGPTTYRWTFDTTFPSPGNYTFSYHIEDDYGGSSSVETFTVAIGAANHPPTIANPGTKSFAHNSGDQTFDLVVDDPDAGDSITVTRQAGPAWGTVTPFGEVTIKTNVAPRGTQAFTWRVTDEHGATAEVTHNVVILNNPPVLQNPGGVSLKRGTGDQSFQLIATDADGDGRTFSKVGGSSQPWGQVASDGLVTIDTDVPPVGSYNFTWEVEDGEGGSDQETHAVVITSGAEMAYHQVI